VFENIALSEIFGLRTVKLDSSAGCYKEDCVVCTVQYQTVRCDLPCVSWPMASCVRGWKLDVGENSVRIRIGNGWLWC